MQPRRRLSKVSRRVFPQGSPQDWLVLEEPLHIVLQGPSRSLKLATILRTPGHDFELVLGYLYSLGLIQGIEAIQEISYCSQEQHYNQLQVRWRGEIPPRAWHLRSPEWIHGGCGACGLEELDLQSAGSVPALAGPLNSQWLLDLPQQLRPQQELFAGCGGCHAAALAREGEPLGPVFEDVGRHNAVDKLVGHLLQQGKLPQSQSWLLLSGRAGFELVHKAVRAGFSAVASLGPPSSRAHSLARSAGLTLVGFLSPQGYNHYD